MSGQENQEQSRDQDSQPSQREAPGLDDLARASVLLPLASLRPALLDYLFYSGIELRPLDYGRGGGGVDDAAFVLANSLYDRRPVKQVIDDEACDEIRDEIFHPEMVEKMKINSACGIWQADFEEGDKIKILPCNHAFGADAIMKWLKEEKAECPICRTALKSKEIICHNNQGHQGHAYAGDNVEEEYEDEDEDEGEGEGEHEEVVNDEVRHNENINNIAMRVAQNLNARPNYLHQQLPRGYHESISVPIRQLIESRRNLVSAYRSYGGGAAYAPRHHQAHDVRAAPVHHLQDNQDADIIIDNNNNANIINIINNNNINNINNNDDDDNNNNNPGNNNNNNNPGNNYNIINNFYYNYINNGDDNNFDQEEADIQEAIRRSLEEN